MGFIFKYFVICDTTVIGDDFIFGNSTKTPRNLREEPKLLTHIARDFFMKILNQRM
jgi:hypothetical protein